MVTCLLKVNEKLPFFLPGTTTTSWKENSFCTDTRPCLTRYPLHTITMHAIFCKNVFKKDDYALKMEDHHVFSKYPRFLFNVAMLSGI